MRFDRTRPYGEVRGMSGIVGYMQGGHEFDVQGNPVAADPPPAPPKVKVPPKPDEAPVVETQPTDAESAEANADESGPVDDGQQPTETVTEETAAPVDNAGAKLVHVGAGRWIGMSADGRRLTGKTMTREEADAWFAALPATDAANAEGQA